MSQLRSLQILAILSLFLYGPASAQIPQGTLLWLDASGLKVGERLDRWGDKSGYSHDATMANPDQRPTVIEDANGVKGLQFMWGQYLQLPAIFPAMSDYTIVAVVRSRDTTTVNNVLSGDHHGFWFDSRTNPGVVHDDHFFQIGYSERSIREGYNILIAEYRESTGMAIHYSNGQFGDSLWIDSNHDSTLYISSYAKSYFSNLDIAEVMLYDRLLDENEQAALEASLFKKYKLPPMPALPAPDRTFAQLPANMQLYPRDENNTATVPISGILQARGWDSITVTVLRDSLPYHDLSSPLVYTSSGAPFSFAPSIVSELHNYDLEVRVKNVERDSLLVRRANIVAGDVYIIGGASNATFGAWGWKNENPFCRTFGMNISRNPRDTLWTVSQVDPWGAGPAVSGWGATIQQLIAEQYHVPTAIINWAVGGTILVHHLKKPGPIYDLQTFYGRLLYRLDKAGLRNNVKAHIFWHGELNDPAGYAEQFYDLYDSLRKDIPSLRKTYLMQLRPSYCSNRGNMMLREFQRHVQDSLPRLETIATAAFDDYDGCHYNDDGGREAGAKIFRIIARDLYAASDTNFLRSPTLRAARYTSEAHDRIELTFEPASYHINIDNDSVFEDISASIRDYFFLDTTWGIVTDMRSERNRVYLGLSHPFDASTISYLPDQHYHGTEVIYRGPWLRTDGNMGVLAFQNVPLKASSSVKNEASSGIALFPDPATDKVRITGSFAHDERVILDLIDVCGRTVLHGSWPVTGSVLDAILEVEHLPRGAYTLRITSSTLTEHHKLILH